MYHNNLSYLRYQSGDEGYTLMSLLLAMMISAVLMVHFSKFVLNIIAKINTLYTHQSTAHELDRAFTMIKAEISQVGQFGCSKLKNTKIIGDHLKLFPQVQVGSNQLTLRYLKYYTNMVRAVERQTIFLKKPMRVRADEMLVLSDCFHTEILSAVADVSQNSLRLSSPLLSQFKGALMLGKLMTVTYSVQMMGQSRHRGLYRYNSHKRVMATPLLSSLRARRIGVSGLQVKLTTEDGQSAILFSYLNHDL